MAEKEDISKILHQLSSFQLQFEKINERIDNLEKQENKSPAQDVNADPANNTSDHDRSNSDPTTTSPSVTTSSTAADIQRDFERIKETLQRTPVPDNYKVRDSAVGIKQDCKQSLKILSKCARYSETAIKIIHQIPVTNNGPDVSEGALNCLFTCVAAQINLLQQEYTNLVVKSTFDDETARIFRQFENNSSTFSDSALQNIRVAAELSTLSIRPSPTQPRRGNPIHRGGRSTGRGFFRGYRGNGVNARSDFAGRTFNARPPIGRPDYDTQGAD